MTIVTLPAAPIGCIVCVVRSWPSKFLVVLRQQRPAHERVSQLASETSYSSLLISCAHLVSRYHIHRLSYRIELETYEVQLITPLHALYQCYYYYSLYCRNWTMKGVWLTDEPPQYKEDGREHLTPPNKLLAK